MKFILNGKTTLSGIATLADELRRHYFKNEAMSCAI